MSGHRPWSEIRHKNDRTLWEMEELQELVARLHLTTVGRRLWLRRPLELMAATVVLRPAARWLAARAVRVDVYWEGAYLFSAGLE